MDDSRRTIINIGIDYLIVLCIGLSILAVVNGPTFQRGFFCDDDSLMYPLRFPTIPDWPIYVVAIVLPIVLISMTEIIQANTQKSNSCRLQMGSWKVPTWLLNSIVHGRYYFFGAVITEFITEATKILIGRLRPHFFSVCQPVMPDGTTCANTSNLGRYIEDYTCAATLSKTSDLKEMRLSFPSGHASITAYTMIYCAIFLHKRMTWRGSNLLKNLLQFLLIISSWYTCMTRISDYQHHWSDVLAGAALGSILALVVSNCVSNLFERTSKSLIPH